jgi:pyruvate dehydrogenase E1 component
MPAQPPDPDDADGRGTIEQGVLAGLYRFEADPDAAHDARRVHLFGSGAIMQEVLDARDRLRALGLAVDVWSVTSHAALGRDLRRHERERLLGATAAEPWIVRQLGGTSGVYVVASDHICAHAEPLGRAAPGPAAVLGTDGFGLSEARPDLRDHFEVSGAWIAFAALRLLARDDGDAPDAFALAREWGLDPERHLERNRFVA